MSRTLVVLAAGVGSRYGGLKQLTPVGPCGETLMEYSIFDALRTGFSRVVMVIRAETEAEIRGRLDATVGRAIPLTYVFQRLDDLPSGFEPPVGRSKPWGTLPAVLAASPAIDGPFAVLNADDFYGLGAFRELERESDKRTDSGSELEEMPVAAVVGFRVADTLSDAGPVSRAWCRSDDGGWVQEMVEIKKIWRHEDGGRYQDADGEDRFLAGHELVSMNMWQLPAAVLPDLRRRFRSFLKLHGGEQTSECLLPDEIQALARESRIKVRALRGPGPWCGLTYPSDKARAEELLAQLTAQGVYPEGLWAPAP